MVVGFSRKAKRGGRGWWWWWLEFEVEIMGEKLNAGLKPKEP